MAEMTMKKTAVFSQQRRSYCVTATSTLGGSVRIEKLGARSTAKNRSWRPRKADIRNDIFSRFHVRGKWSSSCCMV